MGRSSITGVCSLGPGRQSAVVGGATVLQQERAHAAARVLLRVLVLEGLACAVSLRLVTIPRCGVKWLLIQRNSRYAERSRGRERSTRTQTDPRTHKHRQTGRHEHKRSQSRDMFLLALGFGATKFGWHPWTQACASVFGTVVQPALPTHSSSLRPPQENTFLFGKRNTGGLTFLKRASPIFRAWAVISHRSSWPCTRDTLANPLGFRQRVTLWKK